MKFPKFKFKAYRPSGKIAVPQESATNLAVRLQREERKRRLAEEQAQSANSSTTPGVV